MKGLATKITFVVIVLIAAIVIAPNIPMPYLGYVIYESDQGQTRFKFNKDQFESDSQIKFDIILNLFNDEYPSARIFLDESVSKEDRWKKAVVDMQPYQENFRSYENIPCNIIADGLLSDTCNVLSIVSSTGSPSVCTDYLKDDADYCYLLLAIYNTDSNECNRITRNKLRDSCRSAIDNKLNIKIQNMHAHDARYLIKDYGLSCDTSTSSLKSMHRCIVANIPDPEKCIQIANILEAKEFLEICQLRFPNQE